MELSALDDEAIALDRLCELNVVDQARNVCRTSIVQDALKRGQELTVHALVYRLTDGLMRSLNFGEAGMTGGHQELDPVRVG